MTASGMTPPPAVGPPPAAPPGFKKPGELIVPKVFPDADYSGTGGKTASAGGGGDKPLDSKPPRNAALAGKKHPVTGVPFDAEGYPDFKAAGLVKKETKIKLTGDRDKDFALADAEVGITKEYRQANKLTWHHHQKAGVMQLVDTDKHGKTGHTGPPGGVQKKK